MAPNAMSRTDETSRHFVPNHFLPPPTKPRDTLRDTSLPTQEAKSGSERSVSNRPDFETLCSETLLYQHSGGKKWLGKKCPEPTRLKKCLATKCLEPTRLRYTSLRDTSLPTFRMQKVARNEVSRTDQTSRHVAPRHFFTNIQKAKSVSESGRCVSNRRNLETHRSETLL